MQSMKEVQPFNDYDPNLFPRLRAVADWIVQKVAIFPETDLKTSEYLHRNWQPELPFEE